MSALAWFQLCRASSLCTIASNALVVLTAMVLWDGLDLTTPATGVATNIGPLLIVSCIAVLLYSCGMIWNDLADVERDRQWAPNRPLPSGRISLRQCGGGEFSSPASLIGSHPSDQQLCC